MQSSIIQLPHWTTYITRNPPCYDKITIKRTFFAITVVRISEIQLLTWKKHYLAKRKTHWLYRETTTQTLSRNVQFQLHFCWLLHNDSAGAKVTDGGGRSSWSLCSWPCSVVPLLAPSIPFVCRRSASTSLLQVDHIDNSTPAIISVKAATSSCLRNRLLAFRWVPPR